MTELPYALELKNSALDDVAMSSPPENPSSHAAAAHSGKSALEQELASCKQSLAELRQREAFYRELLVDQVDPICCFGGDFAITFVNHAYSALFDEPRVALIGRTILEMIPKQFQASVIAHVKSLTADNPVATAENPIRLANGDIRWFQWTDRLIVDEAGGAVAYQAVGRDVTARRQAEEQERAQRQLAEALLDSLAALTSTQSVDSVLQQILMSATTVVPCDAGSIILIEGKQGRIAYLHGFSSEAAAVLQDYRFTHDMSLGPRVLDHNQSYLIPDTQRWPDWEVLPVNAWVRSSVGVPIVMRGQTIGRLILDSATPEHFQPVDVTKLQAFAQYASLALASAYHVNVLEEHVATRTRELQVAKEQVEAILHNSPGAIFLLESDLRITQINTTFTATFGALANRSLLDLIHPADRAAVTAFVETVSTQPPRHRCEVCVVRDDGSLIDAELSIGPIREGGLVCILLDITERKQAQRALVEERNLLRTVMDAIPEMIYAKDRNHRFILRNHARGHSELDHDPETCLGKTDFDYFSPAAAATFRAEEEAIFRSGRPLLRQEVALTRTDGSVSWVSVTKVPLRNVDGEIIGLVGASHDITHRKEQEYKLRFYASVQENISDAVITTDLELRIQSWNRAAEAIYGWRADEVIGKVAKTVLQAEYEDNRTVEQVRQALLQQGFLQGEAIYYHRNGQPLNILRSLTVFKDKTGEPLGFVLVGHDITGRKETERQLAEERNLLRTLIDAIPNPIYAKDREHRFTLRNAVPSRNVPDARPTAWIGKTDYDFYPAARAEQFWAEEEMILTTGEPLLDRELQITRADGMTIWSTDTKMPLRNLQGEIIGLVGISHDITAIKRTLAALSASEEKYRHLIETMGSGLAIYDSDDRITYANEQYCALLGYSLEELLGTTSYTYLDNASAQLTAAHVARRCQGESTTYEAVGKRKDGQRAYWLVAGSPLYDDQQRIIGSFAIVNDITVQKQAEAMLQQALQKEKELSALKSRFVSTASHEFRTPLTSILLMAETLYTYRNKLTQEQINQRLLGIQKQGHNLKRIMEDVLELAHIQAGHTKFDPARLDLNGFCQSLIDELQPQADGIRLRYECPGALPEANFDKRLMQQVVINLVTNAMKYSSAGQVVTVRLTYQDGAFVLKVTDQGIGIPEADLPYLFQPFHRASNVGSVQGTGLGLVITKEAVELHQGTITVSSELGIGTTFTVTIPQVTAKEPPVCK